MSTLKKIDHLPPWPRRRLLIDPQIEASMCALWQHAEEPGAHSLAVIKAAEVSGIEIIKHPGWTKDEQTKIDTYVNRNWSGGLLVELTGPGL